MRMTVETEYFDEDKNDYVKEEKTLVLPRELKADIGDEADQKLNAEISFTNTPNRSRGKSAGQQANVKITQGQFSETVDYIVREMIDRWNKGDEIDIDNLTNNSKKKVGRHYFNQLEVFDDKKKVKGEGQDQDTGENTDEDRASTEKPVQKHARDAENNEG